MARRCKATKKNGEPCGAYAAAGEEYCNAHLGRIGGDTSQSRKYTRAAKPDSNRGIAPDDFNALDVLEGIAADPKTPHASRVAAARAAADLRRQETPGAAGMSDSDIMDLAAWAARRVPVEYLEETANAAGYDLVKRDDDEATPPPLS